MLLSFTRIQFIVVIVHVNCNSGDKMNITEIAAKRFTTKKYDPTRKISDAQFNQICVLLRNSPSSVNIQPWHFVIAASDEAKKKLMLAFPEFNQHKISDASHVVIFCVKTPLKDEYISAVLEQSEKDGRFANNELKAGDDKGRRYFVELNSKTIENQRTWEEKQIYIALGTLLLGAASMGIDATPIEGFDPKKVDEILKLADQGLASTVVACLGYHAVDDFNATLAKSRLPVDQLFTFI